VFWGDVNQIRTLQNAAFAHGYDALETTGHCSAAIWLAADKLRNSRLLKTLSVYPAHARLFDAHARRGEFAGGDVVTPCRHNSAETGKIVAPGKTDAGRALGPPTTTITSLKEEHHGHR
jgi:hypothetical protein